MDYDEIIDFEQLWDSAFKCKCGVAWKPNVKSFELNALQKCSEMSHALQNGTWKNKMPRLIVIPYPKRREGLSISFGDRVYQRSINDNELYPTMTKSFIYDNCACQKGKGTGFARKRIKKHLWNFYTHYGDDGWVLQIDIHGYYPSLRHDLVNQMFAKRLAPDTAEMVRSILDQQYKGDVGYNPGSQMVQIAGISFLDELDHIIKQKLHVKYYVRYMDDFWMLDKDKQHIKECLSTIVGWLTSHGLTVNEKKTHIKPLSKCFKFLGFNYKMLKNGKVVMTVDSQCVKHERKKLYRLVKKAKLGELTRQKVDECYRSWKAYVKQGNSYKLLKRMDSYYENLWSDNDEDQKEKNADSAGERTRSAEIQN